MKYSDSLMKMIMQPSSGTHRYLGDIVENVGQEKMPFLEDPSLLT